MIHQIFLTTSDAGLSQRWTLMRGAVGIEMKEKLQAKQNQVLIKHSSRFLSSLNNRNLL